MGAVVGFSVDPAFEAGSMAVADWPLCQVRLQDDARFPWLILLPRHVGLTELDQLTSSDQDRLMREIVLAGNLVRDLGRLIDRPVEKLNVAALGNVTAQLHVHVIGRRSDDPAWPDPVWGRGTAQSWPTATRKALISHIALGTEG